MSAKVAVEDHCNTETDEGTAALQKKRSRRVSFAEITSVHVFDREDEYETPPEPKPISVESELDQFKRDLGFQCDGNDSKENPQNEEQEEDGEENEHDARSLFLRPIESPSPGSIIGSATSNDEENFFGPVSSRFIRPGRLSDSAASYDNFDITMDSTAFSQHYCSFARSDSGGDLKTPTGVPLSLGENTPSQNTNPGSFMLLNIAKNPISASSTSMEKLSGASNSNDMSLVQADPNKYDYGRLSFGLDDLLAEGVKDLQTGDFVPISDKINIPYSPTHSECRISPSQRHKESMETHDTRTEKLGPNCMLAEEAPFADKLDDANGEREGSEPFDTIDEKVSHIGTDHMLVLVDTSSDKLDKPTSTSTDELNLSSDLLIKGASSIKSKLSDALAIRPNAEPHVANFGTVSNRESQMPHLDVFVQHDCGSPQAGSLSSLSAKRREKTFEGDRASKRLLITTPQNPGLPVTDEIRRQAVSVPSVSKSVSKLKMVEASPFFSNMDAKMNSVLTSSKSLYRTPPSNILEVRNREDAKTEHVDASAAQKYQMQILDKGNEERNTTINTDVNDVAISGNIIDRSYATGAARIARSGTSPAYRSAEVLASEQFMDLARAKSLLFQFTSSGTKTMTNLLTSEGPTGRIVVTPRSNSWFSEIALDHEKNIKAANTPYKLVPSLDKLKKSVSVRIQGTTSTDDGSGIKIVHGRRDAEGRASIRNARPSTTIAKDLDSVFMEIGNSSSQFAETNHLKEFTALQINCDREIATHDMQDETRVEQNPRPHLTGEESHCLILDENFKMGKDTKPYKMDLTGEGLKVYSSGSPPPSVDRDDSEPFSLKKVMGSSGRSPTVKGLLNAAYDNKLHSAVPEKPLFLNDSQLSYEFEDFSVGKRFRENVIPGETDGPDEIGSLQRSPKLHKYVRCDSDVLSEHSTGGNIKTSKAGHEMSLQHWIDVLSEVLAKKLLPPSIDKLDLQKVGILEDKLVKLQRLQMYETCHKLIQSQKSVGDLASFQRKRTSETKILLHKIVHEHAKLQLMRVKQEKFQRNIQLLQKGIQESQLLKHSLPCQIARCINASINGSHCKSINIRERKEEEVPGGKVTELRQLCDALESELATLAKSVHSSCKMKGELSNADAILTASDYLKKKTCRKYLHLDLQLWKVDSVITINGNRGVVLNYLDFVIQRITTIAGSWSSRVISNQLVDVTILKNFPNMDAWTAFSFALNSNATPKDVGSRSLAQETQITSSVLGNLLDVAQEVQGARLELQNLIYTKFCSPSVGQLDLHLYFIGIKIGRKVALTLDMSCLKWGIYPSDVVPDKLEGSSDLSQGTLPESLSAEIRAAVQSLSVGYLRILRLCRAVSQVVQAWNG